MFLNKNYYFLFNVLLLLILTSSFAIAGGGEGEPIPNQVPLDKLSGITLWLGQLYNNEKLLFALLVTATMGIVGYLIGLVTDVILKIIGLDVSKIAHHE